MDGTITFRRKGQPSTEQPMSLPVYSVDTEEQAQTLQILFCRLQYDGRYTFHDFNGTLEGMDRVAEAFAAAEAKGVNSNAKA